MTATAVTSAQLGRTGSSSQLAAKLLVLGPLVALAGTVVSLVATPDTAMSDIEQVRNAAWPVWQLLFHVGAVTLAAGLALCAEHAFTDESAARAVARLAWLVAPLTLLVMIVSGYGAPALASATGTVSIGDDVQLALLIDMAEAIGNGSFLLIGVVMGLTAAAIGVGARRTGSLSSGLAVAGIGLGALSVLVNLALWLTSDATEAFFLGIATAQTVSFWALGVGVSRLRRG